MTNVVSGSSFHVRIIDKNSSFVKIDQAMNKFDANQAEEL